MRGRRTATLAAAFAVMLSLLAPSFATTDRARPKKPQPNLGIAAVLGAPKEVLAGGRFAAKVLLANDGKAAARPTRLTLTLSRNPAKPAGGIEVGRATTPALGSWKTRAQPVTARVPASAKRGIYYLIACVGTGKKAHCQSAPGGLEVIRPVDGVLTGTIDLFEEGTTGTPGGFTIEWKTSAQIKVNMRLKGLGSQVRFDGRGSAYSWLGTTTTTVTGPDCTSRTVEDEGADDKFWADPANPSTLTGSVLNADLSELRLTAQMSYHVDITKTISCFTPPPPISETRESTTVLDLTQVSETRTSITYKVAGTAAGGAPWEDGATGTLTLKLR